MTSNKKIYKTITGSEKGRFLKEMGRDGYNRLVSHLRKTLGIKDLNVKVQEQVTKKNQQQSNSEYCSMCDSFECRCSGC